MRMRLVSYRRLVEARQANVDLALQAIAQDFGDGWVEVDHAHEGYPRTRLPLPRGPGTELKKLLAKVGITSTPTCSCNKRAKTMDDNGAQWCEENIETICDWLAEEAEKRKLPFIRSAGKLLVRMAIRNAKKGNS